MKVCPNDYEHQFWKEDRVVLGIDEAGRGPLAGPLSVAGVIFPTGYENPEIYDSKACSEKKRDRLYEVIKEEALWFEIIEVSEADIDHYNILEADRRAMLAIAKEAPCDIVLTDAMKLPIDKQVIDLIKGDQKSISIAAGSILAKVTRDRIMKKYDAMYPVYGFAKNKGYPTKQHLDAIAKYGITPIHRRSFGPVRAVQQKLDLF
ncbi:MAG: ribonuclease HII [Erysipelotrichaceae bacterium]|nr:ribonuclease HII [Erysipelotrichaceae bacterium]